MQRNMQGEVTMKKRETELDILRFIAMMAVIWVHVGGMGTNKLPTTAPDCQWLIFLKSIMTWQIPIYVMISGRFFLDPDRQMPFSKIMKSVGRLVLAFVIWNIVYQIFYILTDSYAGLNWKGVLSQGLIGPYHFWYLYMIIGMYLITPLLRKIAEDKKLSEYFIILFFIFSFLTKYGSEFPFVGGTVDAMLDNMNMEFVLGYTGYYILGYYLRKFPISGKWERLLYICSIAMLVFGASANTFCSIQEGVYTERFTGYTNPNTIIIAVAVYTLFINRIGKIAFSNQTIGLITKLSECSFGVYLVHALILEVFALTGLKPTFLHPVLAMPLITILTFAVGVTIVVMIRKIPKVGVKIT